MDTQNYKRTIAGSVGSGMGSLLGASGRTYYILEHKNSSKYHQAGEVQKIIVDQIELGRDGSCQVRFDESFETVSRKHAAIVREGENWKLIHLSHSNPTLVNGNVINGSYYLQTGDEIQLSVGGPRLGFIIPQGRQALTSSIGLTERMNLFRKQALRPYKTALTIMGIVLILALAGLGTWNYTLDKKNEALVYVVDRQTDQMEQYKYQLDSLDKERIRLEYQQKDLAAKLRNSDGDNEVLKSQLNNVREQLSYVNSMAYKTDNEMAALKEELNANKKELAMNESDNEAYNTFEEDSEEDIKEESAGASKDLRDYYDNIYTIKIDRIVVEKDGISFDPGIQLSDIICGTGFMLNNGNFVTDRQNIHPWIYGDEQWKDDWRLLMAECVGAGCNVIIHYRAYSTRGTGKPLTFVNTDFKYDSSDDVISLDIEVRKELRLLFKKNRIKPEYTKRNHVKATILAPKACHWAVIRMKGTIGEGLPYNVDAENNLSGGSEVHMVGYAGNTNIHNPIPAHFNDRTNIDDTQYGTIILQNQVGERGYYGSPAFIKKNNGTYEVIGVMVGSVSGKDRLVPISRTL